MFNRDKKEVNFIRKAFGKYISKDIIESIVNGELKAPEIVEKESGFILLLIEDNEYLLENISKNIDFFVEQNVMIESINSVFIKLCIGALSYEKISNISETLEEIIKKYKLSKLPFYSCVYGKALCRIGNIGNQKIMNYCVVIPEYKEKLLTLLTMEKNEIKLVE